MNKSWINNELVLKILYFSLNIDSQLVKSH